MLRVLAAQSASSVKSALAAVSAKSNAASVLVFFLARAETKKRRRLTRNRW